MKVWKKFSAVALALVMVLALGVSAFATEGDPPAGNSTPATLDGGEVGGYTENTKDTPTSQAKIITIQKELTAYNVDEGTINAPTVSYTYAITAGEANINVTDATTDHENGTAVTVKTKTGITDGVTLTGQGQTSGTSTIAWAPTETLNASTGGTANYKTLSIDFNNVVFGAVGVYRYVITETPPAYAASGVTETTAATSPHVRYLDVYVRPVTSGFNDGTTAAEWDIYGYVCTVESEEITPDGDTTTTGAVKTNGFVAGTNDSTAYKADSYYTFNVTVSKTVTNDNYAKATHAFPFTVLFTNNTITQAVDIRSTSIGTVTGFTDPASAALSEGTTKGILSIKDSSSVKYIGIPCGTNVEVYETNDMPGVTYQVTTTVDGTTATNDDTVDAAVISTTTTPENAVAQATKANWESTKATITTIANADDDTVHSVAIDNNLQLISPTGVTLRYAPYLAMLGAGVVALPLTLRKKEELF